ncbi:hypothetical protein [Catenuloplanes japonicus]|uniref:hypothetical protein n=1 Tax=Catenuloplanes japonicus TaxID=33876 RepID=UPI00052694A8|nr:hypothetical protein [Catenuloplanes japonicus]
MKPDNEEEQARRMLAPLAEEPPADPRIDLATIMRDGSRKRRTRAMAGGAAFAAVLAVTAGAGFAVLPLGNAAGLPMAAGSASWEPSAPTTVPIPTTGPGTAPEGRSCVSQDLSQDSSLMITDRTGRWAVTSTGKFSAPVLVENGDELSAVPMEGEGTGVVLIPTQINSAGAFAAWSYNTGQASKAWVYLNNTPTLLQGTDARAVAIAETGGVIGGKVDERPAVWASPAAAPTMLELPSGHNVGEVVAVSDDGTTVVGTTGNGRTTEITWSDSVGTGTLWLPDGEVRALPLPEGAEWVRPTAMRGDWVVGLVSDGTAFRYNIEADEIETLPSQIVWPSAVASDGAVAGMVVQTPVVFPQGYRSVLLVGDEVRALRPDDPGDTIHEIFGLTDNLQVIGTFVVPSQSRGGTFASDCA